MRCIPTATGCVWFKSAIEDRESMLALARLGEEEDEGGGVPAALEAEYGDGRWVVDEPCDAALTLPVVYLKSCQRPEGEALIFFFA